MQDVLSSYPHLQTVAHRYRNPLVCREKLAHYSLLYEMTGNHSELIGHDANGKPLFADWNISISDTRGWVAILLSKQGRVGVDIEYVSPRISRIVSRFIRPDEDGSSVGMQLVNWTAKEAVYKYFSEQKLTFSQMRLHPFKLEAAGIVDVDNLKEGKSVALHYRLTDSYAVSYVYED